MTGTDSFFNCLTCPSVRGVRICEISEMTYPIFSADDRSTFPPSDCRCHREISASAFWSQVFACNRTRRYHFALACRAHSSRPNAVDCSLIGRSAGRLRCRQVGLVNLHAPSGSRGLIREDSGKRGATVPVFALCLNWESSRLWLLWLAIYVGSERACGRTSERTDEKRADASWRGKTR